MFPCMGTHIVSCADNGVGDRQEIENTQTARKALFLVKWGLQEEAKDVLTAIELSEEGQENN